MKFRGNLLHLRQQRNMAQEQLAMLLGVSRQSVAKWESGQSTPEVDKLVKTADLFGCTLDELVTGDLSEHPVNPAEAMPEDAPAEDVCGYDAHMRKFAFRIAVGVTLIILGIAVALLAFVAGGVWCLVRGGIVHGMTDVANYNRERADEQWERDNPRVGRVCGIIMLAATALGLLLLFGGMAASDAGNSALSTACAYFWVVWPIDGIACGIATLAMKAAADGKK